MKKIFLFAVIAAMGSAVVSCSSDDNEIKDTSLNYPVAARDTLQPPGTGTGDGPGDDPIIITPPPKKP
ncbi:hypothetical protein CLV94_2069 [Flavobacterium endophyticum]|uniref:Lipoprotein n=1 Tax=Flavobacterium endophyticum TaxID=1540163 RepID=A0A495MB23_9FLAO|nr:hypothetical protein [Flavobacterium endophyticum]RKS23164.1 hypothetical protein CLV94_2069 [Flavobacterium endophyticum]